MSRAVAPDRLAVDPVSRIGVALHLHVLTDLLVPHRATLGEKRLDLAENQRVPLHRCRVVRLLEPDVSPDVRRLRRVGKTAQPGPQLVDLGIETAEHLLPGRPAPSPWANLFAIHKFNCTKQIAQVARLPRRSIEQNKNYTLATTQQDDQTGRSVQPGPTDRAPERRCA